VGTVEVVEVEPSTGGYTPPNNGTLAQIDSTSWQYHAPTEPMNELCPNTFCIWIGAKWGSVELARKGVYVVSVHQYYTQGSTRNYGLDYNYLNWKYATVLATTGGAFTTVTISTNTCVPCGVTLPPPFPPPPCVAACTDIEDNVTFGTMAFTQSKENGVASTIGHELTHTVGALNQSECTAYTWELDHAQQTGIFQCDTSYLQDVLQNQNCACNNCP